MLKDREKLEELEHDLKETKMKCDIIGFTETWCKGEQLVQLNSGHVLNTIGGEKSVGFRLHKKIKDSIIEYDVKEQLP